MDGDGVEGLRELSLPEIRERQLRILRAVANHCDEQSIIYYLCAGTLLGAVRHQGYIPWDDDVDIMLPRADYQRLCETFPTGSASSGITLYSTQTSADFGLPFAKVCDDTTMLKVESDVVTSIGVFIDVFPIDGWYASRVGTVAQRAAIEILTRLMLIKHLQLNDSRSSAKNTLLRVLKTVMWPLSARGLAHALTWTARLPDERRSANLGVLVWGYHESVPRQAYGEPRMITFEGASYPGPTDANIVLSTLYGDYWVLPPEAERVTHHRFSVFAID